MEATTATPNNHLPFKLEGLAKEILDAAPSVTVAGDVNELTALAVSNAGPDGWHEIAYDVPGRGRVVEAKACRVKNGIAANYLESYMRRRDPDCMIIGDGRPTDKPTFESRFNTSFDGLREETIEWLKGQDLAVFGFVAGMPGKGTHALAICPANAGFFAMGLAMLQGILPIEKLDEEFKPKAIIYVAPPFRHTHFEGKQVVVHNRLDGMHELFSYNLYPGPSAKKGIYGVLLTLGETEEWVTMHCSTVEVITPYEGKVVISHEGASGGGKSEMLEQVHRQEDGSMLLGRNIINGDKRTLTLPSSCSLNPVTDDMALCHPSPLQRDGGKLSLMDAEDAWFVRVNHISAYGTDPHLEAKTISPSAPLLFLNIQAEPNSTALIWEHIEDSPGQPCPNPRVIIPRHIVDNVVEGEVEVDIRSFGVRCPPCTRENPSYGILGMFHILPPALAWLWRLVAPRGHANPSIVQTAGMSSEGVGSYWPFATGRMVDQANLLLRQIINTPAVRYTLVPNQHIGAWETSFMPQWVTREYLARRGGAEFAEDRVKPSRCPLLGWHPTNILVEGRQIGSWFFEVDKQPEVGESAYDQGAKMLSDFFHNELRQFLVDDLDPKGREIIECCLSDGSLDDYTALIDHPVLRPGKRN
ncbi:DUF4914 family protein [Rubellicoccus peritrichatus]|uniref:DUF4914 family protein n=1 Tax=Rubellicoccus peritrichatus TaxID=3080537 RepID=A0AAQ3L839_9BACT|nr:DUF4914 family protein [Puniceicoccus sp. CR14]WOO40661.1 DUF4914 family protein [Puniceicoccus sp. CR14]